MTMAMAKCHLRMRLFPKRARIVQLMRAKLVKSGCPAWGTDVCRALVTRKDRGQILLGLCLRCVTLDLMHARGYLIYSAIMQLPTTDSRRASFSANDEVGHACMDTAGD